MYLIIVFLCTLVTLGLIVARVCTLVPGRGPGRRSTRRRDATDTCTLAIFLGSGGHTTEVLTLLSALDFTRYAPRKYIVSEGDILSAEKVLELEENVVKHQNLTGTVASYEILVVPRARRVHQSLVTTPRTVISSLISILGYLIHNYFASKGPFADILLLNGPGTCFVLCFAIYVLKFFGLATPRIVYIESYARVRSLSLSGRLLRPFVDRFVVQWPQLLSDGGRGECRGWLV